ncbi:MAG: hypothetical protein DDT19_02161 [Syntrophomonadaceae bacterium]|nr:hypothetical protein [Bacillota bacterium]
MDVRKCSALLVVEAASLAFLAVDDASARDGSRGSSGGYKSYRGAKAIDGDTYRYQGERYRVQQYDAPERGTPGSGQATRQLQRKLDSGSHEYKPVARDAYGRTIVRERPDFRSNGRAASAMGQQLSAPARRSPRRWAIKPHNRNEPQVHPALDAMSPPDAVSRARLRKTVGEARGEQRPLIIVRRNDACSAHDRVHKQNHWVT